MRVHHRVSTNLSAGLQTGLLEAQQCQHVISGGVGLQGLADDMPQDHRQPGPAEPAGLIQNSGKAAAPHQPRQVLRPGVGRVQTLRYPALRRRGAGGSGGDQENFERLALAVRQEEQDDGGVQRKTRLLALAANF